MASVASVGVADLGRRFYYLSKGSIASPGHIPVGLLDLPIELQIHILSLLEWNEVLRARQTCRRLHDVSLARPVWLALVKLYSTTVFPRPFCLEKPLELYTDRELELLVLRWQKSRVCWALCQSQSKIVPVVRQFSCLEKARNRVHLVEGGRWLLVGTNSGSVLCYDLEASVIAPTTLIPTPFDEDIVFNDDGETEFRLSVDMDLEAEYLTFNLGVITRRVPASNPNPNSRPRFFRWIQVWRVESDVDENGVVKGLRAERLACFPEQHENRCDAFRLQGQHVSYSFFNEYEFSALYDGHCIIIVDWTLCDSASLVYPRRVIWQAIADWLALLPENKLLCHVRKKLMFHLFDLDATSMTTLDPSQYYRHLTIVRSDPIASLFVIADAISEPYFFPHSTRVSVLSQCGVKGVTIPHSNGISRKSTIKAVNLLSRFDLDAPQSSFIGYDRALIFSWPDLVSLRYAWPDEGPCNSIVEKTIDQTGDAWSFNVLFDKSSGRIVLATHNTKKEVLLCLDS